MIGMRLLVTTRIVPVLLKATAMTVYEQILSCNKFGLKPRAVPDMPPALATGSAQTLDILASACLNRPMLGSRLTSYDWTLRWFL